MLACIDIYAAVICHSYTFFNHTDTNEFDQSYKHSLETHRISFFKESSTWYAYSSCLHFLFLQHNKGKSNFLKAYTCVCAIVAPLLAYLPSSVLLMHCRHWDNFQHGGREIDFQVTGKGMDKKARNTVKQNTIILSVKACPTQYTPG